MIWTSEGTNNGNGKKDNVTDINLKGVQLYITVATPFFIQCKIEFPVYLPSERQVSTPCK